MYKWCCRNTCVGEACNVQASGRYVWDGKCCRPPWVIWSKNQNYGNLCKCE